jgi:hypothetical protein
VISSAFWLGASHLLRTREPGLINSIFSGVGDVLPFRPVCQNGLPPSSAPRTSGFGQGWLNQTGGWTHNRFRVKSNRFPRNHAVPTCFRVTWRPRTVPKWHTWNHSKGAVGVWRGHGGGKDGEGRAPALPRGPSSVPFWHTATPRFQCQSAIATPKPPVLPAPSQGSRSIPVACVAATRHPAIKAR